MFVLPCKYVDTCLIETAVKAIRKYHSDVKILVVDSDSADKSYFEKLSPYNVIIADIANQNYESGAFWYAVENYNEDYYVVLQDSMILNKSIENAIEAADPFFCFMHFFESSAQNYTHLPTAEWIGRINEMLGNCEKLSLDTPVNYAGVFGPNFIIKRSLVDKMLELGLDKTIRPTNKIEHQMTERVYGIVASQLGVTIPMSSLLGDFHEVRVGKFNPDTATLYTEYFNKVWFNSQRV